MQYEFVSNLRHIGHLAGTPSMADIITEPMVHGASFAFAMSNGGPLTQAVLDALERHASDCPPHKYVVIDTRVQMLMPGMYPCIPGWHCDSVYRPHPTAQPLLEVRDADCWHFTYHQSFNFSGLPQICPTEFLKGRHTLDVDPENIWGSVDREVNNHRCAYEHSNDGDIVRFSRDTVHRCSPSAARGWRFWFRMSYYHNPPLDQMRNQVQVYTVPTQGW